MTEDHVKYKRNIKINIYTEPLVMVNVINMYTGTLTLREDRRLMAFENGALRKGMRGKRYWGTVESLISDTRSHL